MKKRFRNFVFLIMMTAAFLSGGNPTRSQNIRIPPVECVSVCTFQLSLCFSNGAKGNENSCISVYRRCLAQCKND